MEYDPEPFRPARLLRAAHAQTIFGRLLRREGRLPLRRERLETPDGDFLDLDYAPEPTAAQAPLVLLLHGLEGSARRGYAVNVYRALARRGVASVGMNFRSCSGEVNRTARFYHSGETGDLRFVIQHLRSRFPGRRLGAIGFSLGGNALLKYLGEEGEQATLAAAVAVSVPFDLAAGARNMEASRMGRFYTSLFLKTLREKAEIKRELLDGKVDLERIRAARSFPEFDDAATAPLHGFAGAADYYARSSSAAYLERIRIPTLLIHSKDDPFLPSEAIPSDAIEANPCLRAIITERGGHVGFVGGSPWSPVFWAEREAARFLAARLEAAAVG